MAVKNSEGSTAAQTEDVVEMDDMDIEIMLSGQSSEDIENEGTEDNEESTEAEASETGEESEDEDEADEEESENEDDSTEEEAESVLSQINYDELTKEQAEEMGRELHQLLAGSDKAADFGKGFGSGAGKELGKLRGTNHALSEENERLKKQVDEQLTSITGRNAYSEVDNLEQLDKRHETDRGFLAAYRQLVDQNSWKSNDDGDEGEYDADGKFWTKDVLQSKALEIQDKIDSYYQQKDILRAKASVDKVAKDNIKAAEDEIEWLSDKDGDTYKEYQKVLKDNNIDLVKRAFPVLGGNIESYIAYALDAKEGRTSRRKTLGKLPLKRAATLGTRKGSGGTNGNGESKRNKKRSGLMSRINTGEYTDDDIASLISG